MEVLGLDEPPALGGAAAARNRGAPNFAEQPWAGLAAGGAMDRNLLAQAREALTANYGQAERVAREWMNGIMANNGRGAPGVHEQVTLPHARAQDPGQGGEQEQEPGRRAHRGERRVRRERRGFDGGRADGGEDPPDVAVAAAPAAAMEPLAEPAPAERRPTLQRRTTSTTNTATARAGRRQSALVDMFSGR